MHKLDIYIGGGSFQSNTITIYVFKTWNANAYPEIDSKSLYVRSKKVWFIVQTDGLQSVFPKQTNFIFNQEF